MGAVRFPRKGVRPPIPTDKQIFPGGLHQHAGRGAKHGPPDRGALLSVQSGHRGPGIAPRFRFLSSAEFRGATAGCPQSTLKSPSASNDACPMWLCSRDLKVMTITFAAAKLLRVAYNFGIPTIDLTETERLALQLHSRSPPAERSDRRSSEGDRLDQRRVVVRGTGAARTNRPHNPVIGWVTEANGDRACQGSPSNGSVRASPSTTTPLIASFVQSSTICRGTGPTQPTL
jgi:hypothetical protein